MHKEAILAAHQWRHACQEFNSSKKINDEDFQFLLQVLSLAPSSFGLQPYEVFVLKDMELLKKLHPYIWGAQRQFFSCSHVLMFTIKKDIAKSDDYLEHMLIDVQQTPADMLDMRRNLIKEYQITEIKKEEDIRFVFDWAAKQAYIALGNVMHAAASIGIDSCPVEGFVSNEVTRILMENKVLDSEKYAVTVFCCLGYRLNPPVRAKVRKPLEELVNYV